MTTFPRKTRSFLSHPTRFVRITTTSTGESQLAETEIPGQAISKKFVHRPEEYRASGWREFFGWATRAEVTALLIFWVTCCTTAFGPEIKGDEEWSSVALGYRGVINFTSWSSFMSFHSWLPWPCSPLALALADCHSWQAFVVKYPVPAYANPRASSASLYLLAHHVSVRQRFSLVKSIIREDATDGSLLRDFTSASFDNLLDYPLLNGLPGLSTQNGYRGRR